MFAYFLKMYKVFHTYDLIYIPHMERPSPGAPQFHSQTGFFSLLVFTDAVWYYFQIKPESDVWDYGLATVGRKGSILARSRHKARLISGRKWGIRLSSCLSHPSLMGRRSHNAARFWVPFFFFSNPAIMWKKSTSKPFFYWIEFPQKSTA